MDHYRSSKPKNAAPVNKRHSASKGNYRRGEVYYARDVKFDGSEGSKDRPVICLSADGDAMRCLKCTSSGGARGLYEILDYIGAGLDHATYVDPKPFNLPRSKIIRYMGELNEVDYANLDLDEFRSARIGPRTAEHYNRISGIPWPWRSRTSSPTSASTGTWTSPAGPLTRSG